MYRVILCLFACVFLFAQSKSHAESVELKITVHLVACGKKSMPDTITRACRKDERCCVFVDEVETNLVILESSSALQAYQTAEAHNKRFE